MDIDRINMRSEAFQTAKIYRDLLKAVKKHIGKEENKRHFLEFVTSEFRNNRNLSDGVAVQHKIKLARDYTFLLNGVHHHKVLLSFCCIFPSKGWLYLYEPVGYKFDYNDCDWSNDTDSVSLKLNKIPTALVILRILQIKSKRCRRGCHVVFD